MCKEGNRVPVAERGYRRHLIEQQARLSRSTKQPARATLGKSWGFEDSRHVCAKERTSNRVDRKKGDKSLPFGPLRCFGVFGGSFNPVHCGHLEIARQVRAALQLERVFLVPAATPPHKREDVELASAADRVTMCRLAVQDFKGLAVWDGEVRRGGVSYTVATLQWLRQAYGRTARIYFLLGSDSLAELAGWREAEELIFLAEPAIAFRRTAPVDEELWKKLGKEFSPRAVRRLRHGLVPVRPVDLSATEIRRCLRIGFPVAGMLPPVVEDYIREQGLFGTRR